MIKIPNATNNKNENIHVREKKSNSQKSKDK